MHEITWKTIPRLHEEQMWADLQFTEMTIKPMSFIKNLLEWHINLLKTYVSDK